MNFLKKIFGKRSSEPNLGEEKIVATNVLSGDNLPADEQFAINFTQNGGKFIYCTSELEIQHFFRNILMEIGVYVKISTPNESLVDFFEEHQSLFTDDVETANVYLTTCEYLITSMGGIMLSSSQLRQRRTSELPEIFIVLAKTSQMVKSIDEGMRGINLKYPKQKPTGLVTLRSFDENRTANDVMNYGGSYKKTYLILLEDLPI